jgi:microcin C transport system permease protein
MLRFSGFFLLLAAIGSSIGEWNALVLPTLSWGFELSRSAEWLHLSDEAVESLGKFSWLEPWFGWFTVLVVTIVGIFLIFKFARHGVANPVTLRKIERFKKIKRGYYSFLILIGLGGLAALDQVLVGKEALVVDQNGELTFPAFTRKLEKGSDYGLKGEEGVRDPDYRELKKSFKDTDNWALMPLWPYSPTNDSISALARTIPEEDGQLRRRGKGYSGLGTRLYDYDEPENPHLRYRYRKGLKDGDAQGWDREGNRIYGARYEEGELVEGSEFWDGEGSLEEFLGNTDQAIYDVSFPPSEPTWRDSPRHYLGTTSEGYDVIAYLYGGLKVNFQAAIIYVPIVYLIGISIGLLMGFFGGTFDLVVQRLIEVLSNIPFLFLVVIVSSSVPAQWKDRFGLYIILGILAAFGWMGMTYLMRTAALKEKARDYVAAARVIGASTPRILFRHLLPNSIAIVVTLIPFSESGLILSLTSLDYLGFGLPAKYATWGKLLKDGLENLSSPWLVSAAFLCLVCLLVLVTFVGEAIREAFDPKKYTFYR